jgi:hypothetical protein
MRRARRNGHGGLEFGGSGEDSFVAVVVTKLTGALLFILLLTMVIMALLPKAIDLPASDARKAGAESSQEKDNETLAIATPERLPEAIAGRPYTVALAARGGRGPLRWAVDGTIPEGLTFDPESGQIRGTPKKGTAEPAALVLRVSDGSDRVSQSARLVVYQSDQPLALPSKWMPGLPPIPWRAWLEQGFGFLVLWLVHLVGMNALASLQRWSQGRIGIALAGDDASSALAVASAAAVRRRFLLYRMLVRLSSLSAAAALALWLVTSRP